MRWLSFLRATFDDLRNYLEHCLNVEPQRQLEMWVGWYNKVSGEYGGITVAGVAQEYSIEFEIG